jgi:hypothetical protein
MIYSLRQQHRRIVIALSLFLPAIFVLGIAARRPVPIDRELSVPAAEANLNLNQVLWERPGLFSKSPVTVGLWGGADLSKAALKLTVVGDFVQPDVMVYWVAGTPKTTHVLPDQAVLLGAFSSRIFPLRRAWRHTAGVIVLYSVADGAIVDVSQPVQWGDLPQKL